MACGDDIVDDGNGVHPDSDGFRKKPLALESLHQAVKCFRVWTRCGLGKRIDSCTSRDRRLLVVLQADEGGCQVALKSRKQVLAGSGAVRGTPLDGTLIKGYGFVELSARKHFVSALVSIGDAVHACAGTSAGAATTEGAGGGGGASPPPWCFRRRRWQRHHRAPRAAVVLRRRPAPSAFLVAAAGAVALWRATVRPPRGKSTPLDDARPGQGHGHKLNFANFLQTAAFSHPPHFCPFAVRRVVLQDHGLYIVQRDTDVCVACCTNEICTRRIRAQPRD